ncbi:MAG: hypothetical protein ACFWT6_05160 [Virgibacillus proomii]|jgi:hypothetical protein
MGIGKEYLQIIMKRFKHVKEQGDKTLNSCQKRILTGHQMNVQITLPLL